MPDFGMRRMTREVLNSIKERDKRNVGMGFVGRLFERNYRPDRMNSYVKKQIDELDDHRWEDDTIMIYFYTHHYCWVSVQFNS